MYQISKLTGKIYLNNIEIIQDDRLEEWQTMYQWQMNGGTFQEIESHFLEIELQKENKIKELKIFQYKELLPTDWYYTRFLETGQEVPLEIIQQRQTIREKYNNLINEINNE